MVDLSIWNPARMLLAPMCGSGTIAIEAAMIGRNMAPGLRRQFDSEEWPFMPKEIWDKAREEAEDAMDRTREFRILASDIDGRLLRTARQNVKLAGVEEFVAFQTLPLKEIKSKKKYGCIITNPPYGERMGELREAEALYKEMSVDCNDLDTWSFYVLTSHKGFERIFGQRADRKRKLYNGRIQVDYYQFHGPRPPRQTI